MPSLAYPMPAAGNTNGLGQTAPLRNKGIYLERGDRIYVGVFADDSVAKLTEQCKSMATLLKTIS
jgi:hypothetical protein